MDYLFPVETDYTTSTDFSPNYLGVVPGSGYQEPTSEYLLTPIDPLVNGQPLGFNIPEEEVSSYQPPGQEFSLIDDGTEDSYYLMGGGGPANKMDNIKVINIGDGNIEEIVQIDETNFDPNEFPSNVSFSKNYVPNPEYVNMYRKVFKKVFAGAVPLDINNPQMPCDRTEFDIIWDGLVHRYNTLNEEVVAESKTTGNGVKTKAKFDRYLMFGRLLENIQKLNTPCNVYTDDGEISDQTGEEDMKNLIYAFIFANHQTSKDPLNSTTLPGGRNPSSLTAGAKVAIDALKGLNIDRAYIDKYIDEFETARKAKSPQGAPPPATLKNLYVSLDDDTFKKAVDAEAEIYRNSLMTKLSSVLKGTVTPEAIASLKTMKGGDRKAMVDSDTAAAIAQAPTGVPESTIIDTVANLGKLLENEQKKDMDDKVRINEIARQLEESQRTAAQAKARLEQQENNMLELERKYAECLQCCSGREASDAALTSFKNQFQQQVNDFTNAKERLTNTAKEAAMQAATALQQLSDAQNEATRQKQIASDLAVKLKYAFEKQQDAKVTAVGGAMSRYIQEGGWWGGDGEAVVAPVAPVASIIQPAPQAGAPPPPAAANTLFNEAAALLNPSLLLQKLMSAGTNFLGTNIGLSSYKEALDKDDTNAQKQILNTVILNQKEQIKTLQDALNSIKNSKVECKSADNICDIAKLEAEMTGKSSALEKQLSNLLEQNKRLIEAVDTQEGKIEQKAQEIATAEKPSPKVEEVTKQSIADNKAMAQGAVETTNAVAVVKGQIAEATAATLEAKKDMTVAKIAEIQARADLVIADTPLEKAAAEAKLNAATSEIATAQAELVKAEAKQAAANIEITKITAEVNADAVIAAGAIAEARSTAPSDPTAEVLSKEADVATAAITSQQNALQEANDALAQARAKEKEVRDAEDAALAAAKESANAKIAAEIAKKQAEEDKKKADAELAAANAAAAAAKNIAEQQAAAAAIKEAQEAKAAAVAAKAASEAAAAAAKNMADASSAAAAAAATAGAAAAAAAAVPTVAPPPVEPSNPKPTVKPAKPSEKYESAKHSIKGVIGSILQNIAADGPDINATWNKSIVDIFSTTNRPKTVAAYKATEIYTFLKSYKTLSTYFSGITDDILKQSDSVAMAFSILFKNISDKPPGGAKDRGLAWMKTFVEKLTSAYVNTFHITKLLSPIPPPPAKPTTFDRTISAAAREAAIIAEIDKKLLKRNVLDTSKRMANPTPSASVPGDFTFMSRSFVTAPGKAARPITFSEMLKITSAQLNKTVQAK